MNKLEQQLNTMSREIEQSYTLSKSERASMFKHVLEHVHAPEKIPSPYHKVSFPHVMFMNAKSFALLTVFLCTGVLSYAAEKALPGDSLYAVKTQFNENLQSFLTFSPQSKAKLEAALAEKRLVEAQKLAATDRLSPANDTQLQQSFQQHSNEFKKTVQSIGTNEPDAAISLSNDFQTALVAHETVLKTLSTSTSAVTINVGKEISSLDDVRKQAEGSVSNLLPEEIRALAIQKQLLTSSALNELSVYASSTASTTDETMLSLQIQIVAIEAISDKGTEALEAGKYFDAYVYFQTALREAKNVALASKSGGLIIDVDLEVSIATSTTSSTIPVIQSTSTPATTTNPVQ